MITQKTFGSIVFRAIQNRWYDFGPSRLPTCVVSENRLLKVSLIYTTMNLECNNIPFRQRFTHAIV